MLEPLAYFVTCIGWASPALAVSAANEGYIAYIMQSVDEECCVENFWGDGTSQIDNRE